MHLSKLTPRGGGVRAIGGDIDLKARRARVVPSRFCYSRYALWEGLTEREGDQGKGGRSLLFLPPSQNALRAVISSSKKNKVKVVRDP
jgi:hypothetical protein